MDVCAPSSSESQKLPVGEGFKTLQKVLRLVLLSLRHSRTKAPTLLILWGRTKITLSVASNQLSSGGKGKKIATLYLRFKRWKQHSLMLARPRSAIWHSSNGPWEAWKSYLKVFYCIDRLVIAAQCAATILRSIVLPQI
jgi:hypothetical protein